MPPYAPNRVPNQCSAAIKQQQDGRADQVIGRLYRGVVRCWVLLAVLSPTLLLAAEEPADQSVESRRTTVPSLHGRTALLIDPSRKLSLADVLRQDKDFAHLSTSSVNLGSTRDAAWLRIRLTSESPQTALLTLRPTFVDFVDVYVVRIAEDLPVLTPEHFSYLPLGDHRPRPPDDLSALDDSIPLELDPEHTTLVYVRIASVNSTLTLSPSLHPAAEHTLRTTLTSFSYGLWFGGMVVLVLIQLAFFHFDRKPYHLLLAISSCGTMLVYAANLGLSRLLLFPQGGWGNDLFHSGSVWLGLTASALMTASVLELHRYSRWLLLLFRVGAGVGLMGAGMVLAGENLSFAPFGNLVIVLLSTLAMVQSLRTRDDTGSGTTLRSAAFTILWIGLVATIAQRSSIYDLPNWVSQTYGISSLLFTILLTAGLGAQLRAAERKNRLISAQALGQARAAEQQATALVAERTAELAAAKKQAEDALQAELDSQRQQIRFMEIISHQYRTPLASIRTTVDSIDLSLRPSDTVNRQRIDRIRRGIARLVEVVELNLARSRLQGPSFKPALTEKQLGELVRSAIARCHDLIPNADIKCEMDPAVASIQIDADAEMLETAIINLLENAAKFSRGLLPPRIWVCCLVDTEHASIAVRDEGIGIPARELGSITRRFARASNVAEIEGSGVGLSLVQRIASIHGGDLTIDSIEHVGTTVRIRLPLKRPIV